MPSTVLPTTTYSIPPPIELPILTLHPQESYDAYIFSNIRFAAPPTGTLRFGAPQPPLEDRTTVHDGSIGFICPQAEPTYLPQAKSTDPASEDCLFLDVIVPRKVLNGDLGDVPVLFWFVPTPPHTDRRTNAFTGFSAAGTVSVLKRPWETQ